MKILFAVNNDNVSEAIVKKYEKEYKEILSYKNVYYFNAILRELQKDKSYSRIVISEDLEPFANNNYNSIDNFLFEKYSNIVEEIKSQNNESIDIILLCADRRRKTDDILTKIYKKGIYNALVGQDRIIDEVCRLINRPRDKEDAKKYYNIVENELGEFDTENSVSEAEVQNILAHYKRLGKNEDKYVESFNNIVSQYTDAQLKIIIKYLPMHVKAVLEERSPKYQQIAVNQASKGIDAKRQTISYKEKLQEKQESNKNEIDYEIDKLIKPIKIKNVVIPTNIKVKNVQKISKPIIQEQENTQLEDIRENNVQENNIQENNIEEIIKEVEETTVETPKRGRGRPRKYPIPTDIEDKPKRGRGRPRKQKEEEKIEDNIEESNDEVDLFNLDNEDIQNETEDLFDFNEEENTQNNDEVDLFNLDDEEQTENNEETTNLFDNIEQTEKVEDVDLFNIQDDVNTVDNINEETVDTGKSEETKLSNMEKNTGPDLFNIENEENVDLINQHNKVDTDFNSLLTSDKKIVAFVGTTKNGTSFIVNNTAEMLASMGIETAILDMTQSKNAYYIYTNNEESLRMIAKESMENLQKGIANGINVKKNLTVYTEMPGEKNEYEIEKILTTLLQNYSAILIDTDFDTPDEIFEKVQEIYLVQTMDVLTIQPLTAFLRNLKSKNILATEKLKIVINKSQRVRSLSIKTLIGGMSCYNSPSMTYMTELFNRDNIRYCEVPFDTQNYVKYLDSLVNCKISLNGYTKQLILALKELANMVYPLINKQSGNSYSTMNNKRMENPFSNQTNETLNKMRNKY